MKKITLKKTCFLKSKASLFLLSDFVQRAEFDFKRASDSSERPGDGSAHLSHLVISLVSTTLGGTHAFLKLLRTLQSLEGLHCLLEIFLQRTRS